MTISNNEPIAITDADQRYRRELAASNAQLLRALCREHPRIVDHLQRTTARGRLA